MLQNECKIEERFRDIKKQNYTIKLTDEEIRELNRYHAFYNANKIAYMMSQNKTALEYAEEVKLNGMMYNPQKRDLEPMKLSKIDDHLTKVLLKERAARIKDIPEIEYLTEKEVEQAIDIHT